jgi:fucose 4-O-acetylase-like acetyltransferase
MPLFFFLSGYVFNAKYNFNDFVKRKIKSIIIPYFALGMVMAVFSMICTGNFEFHYMKILILNLIIQRRLWTLWYMACLFCLDIVFYLLVKKIKSLKYLFIVVIGMLIVGLLYYNFGGVALPWNVDTILTSSIFFFVGYWVKINYSQIREYINKSKSIIMFIVIGIVNVIFGYMGIKISGQGLDMFHNSYGFPPFTCISAFAGIICVVIFAHWFNLRGIKYIGRNSMIYYAWHQTIMIPIVQKLLQYVGITTAGLNSFTLFGERIFELLVILAMSTVCHIVISRTKLKFMIGK